jgi:hypothetical protein
MHSLVDLVGGLFVLPLCIIHAVSKPLLLAQRLDAMALEVICTIPTVTLFAAAGHYNAGSVNQKQERWYFQHWSTPEGIVSIGYSDDTMLTPVRCIQVKPPSLNFCSVTLASTLDQLKK